MTILVPQGRAATAPSRSGRRYLISSSPVGRITALYRMRGVEFSTPDASLMPFRPVPAIA